MNERRDDDDMARLLRSVLDRVAALERGTAGSLLLPTGHLVGAQAASGILGVPIVVVGAVTNRTVWAVPVIVAGATPTVTLRVESAGSWTVAAGIVRIDTSETAITPVSHSTSGGWSGSLVLSNGGGTPTTTGLFYLSATVGGGSEIRVTTTAIS